QMLPDGIGGHMDENEVFILELHIANASETALDAYAKVTIDPAPSSEIEQYSGVLFYVNQDFTIPPGAGIHGAPLHTDAAMRPVPKDVSVFRMQSHTHKRMKRVDAWLADGGGADETHIYKNEDWHSPIMRTFDDP